MATNQRTGIIAKYVKDFGLVQGLSGIPTMASVPSTGLDPQKSWFSSSPGYSTSSVSFLPQSIISGIGSSTGSTKSFVASGGYALEVLFYIFLYGFVLFFILLLIHFTLYPIFQFSPGSNGLIPMATSYDYTLYWVGGVQPISPAPDQAVVTDSLNLYNFDKLYSLSVDIYLTDLTGRTGLDRLIFYGSSDSFFSTNNVSYALDSNMSLAENFAMDASLSGVNMICYIAEETNDLIITYFVKTNNGVVLQKNSIPIQNIPLFTSFRITIVHDNKMFIVYYNGLQISQTSVLNTNPRNEGAKKRFYANILDTKCGYVQTLMLWNRAISYPEIVGLPIALTGKAKFNVSATNKTIDASCSRGSRSPASRSPASGSSASGSPASGSSASGSPASGSPASGSPASGTT
jgi:hypothetical protein